MGASFPKPQGAVRTAALGPALAEPLFDSADRMFAVDASHRITFWNAASERLLNIPARQALGAPCYKIVRGCNLRGQPVCGPHCGIPRLASGGAAPERFALTLDDGNGTKADLWVSIVLAPSPHDGVWSVLHVLRNANASPAGLRKDAQTRQPGAAAIRRAGEHAVYTPASALTARELELLHLMAEGLPAAMIAEQLYISCATVRNHIQHVLAKLRLHSRVEAVAYAYRHQLLQSPVHAVPGKGDEDDEEDCRSGPR